MAGPNTTGLPNTEDYNLGRGIIYFAPLDANGKPVAYRDLGNAPEFNVTIETETLEHESSREGLKVVDKEVIIKQGVALSFSLDEVNDENLAMVLSGSQSTHTNAAVAGFAEYVMIPDGKLEKGRWYDIVNSTGERAYDIGTLTVKTNEGTPVTLVLNTDYKVDTEMGRIFFLSTSTAVATSIAAGKGIKVTLAARAGAHGVDEVRALTTASVIGALKFVSANAAADGRKRELQFHKVTLKAEGDLGLISDDWTQMRFTAKAERNEGADSDSPTLTIRTVRAA